MSFSGHNIYPEDKQRAWRMDYPITFFPENQRKVIKPLERKININDCRI